ncbi:hypothetical protein [Hyalangium rubrum]|uniref:Anti-sigma factor n=1 Tax=Hyalangium rubrum TaxID=3103134 RepID=A0ABU5H8E2_9BACT|nr:hypothetical protein [Hyalangium sp. s54d21]MDY7229748.1 hypothetical protein [Hyalangium sp. s54d21]
MKHLDANAMRALSAREPEAVAYFREHLAAPCDTCEEFLAQSADTDGLDGQVDALLLGLAPRPEAPRNEVGWMRLRRHLRAPSRTGRWAGAAAALAACLLAVVFVPRLIASPPREAAWDGVKGSNRIALELAVVARSAQGELRRLDFGASVLPDEVLLLRYHATEAGSALLFQQQEGGTPELLGAFSLQAGTHDLQGPQGLAGVSLTGESGAMTLWLVASAPGVELSEEQVRAALGNGTAQGQNPLAIAQFDVFVQTGHNPR